ncbi:hypothetical protein COOONC_25159, partial [Cooperia oncophora]
MQPTVTSAPPMAPALDEEPSALAGETKIQQRLLFLRLLPSTKNHQDCTNLKCSQLLRPRHRWLLPSTKNHQHWLEKLVSMLPVLSPDFTESEERERSVIIYGVPEEGAGSLPSLRQEHTEKNVSAILDVLDIEARPVEVRRIGKISDKPRLTTVFPFSVESEPPSFLTYVQQKKEQRTERDLRKLAFELNRDEHNGNPVLIVYR